MHMNTATTPCKAAGWLLLCWLLSSSVVLAGTDTGKNPERVASVPPAGSRPDKGTTPARPVTGPRLPVPISSKTHQRVYPTGSELPGNLAKKAPANPRGTTPLRLLPNLPILPYKPLPLATATSLLAANQTGAFDYDPIRFTMTASKDSVAIGEEFELTIRAELLDIPPSVLFFFEEQKSFSLKVLMPEGFVQTGGDYYDHINARLNPSRPTVTYTLKGKYGTIPASQCFTLLRGPEHPNSNS